MHHGEQFRLEKLPADRSRIIYPPEPLEPIEDPDGAMVSDTFLFNVTGVIWAVVLFTPFLALVQWLVPVEVGSDGVMSAVGIATTLAAHHVDVRFNQVAQNAF